MHDRKTLDEECSALSDAHVVVRVLAGHTALFEVLMRRYNQRLYRTARAFVGDDQAEHAMEQAYVHAYGRLRDYHARQPFATWLTRILVAECRARLRGESGASS